MAQVFSIKLSRFDSQPWGFRLQGGKDFGQPLAVQKVNGNSIAEKAGLQAGDSVIKVNNVELYSLSHKDAQNAIVRAGNSFELTVQRGGSVWKPSVTPIGPAPTSQNTGGLQPVTKTSLAYKPPSATQVNGESAKNLASKLYNSPVGLYSEETIAETLSAQTEVLAGGVLGVNFKKNEKTYNAANSEVLKMVQEIDNEPREPEPADSTAPIPVSAPTTPKLPSTPAPNYVAGLRHVAAPETKPEAPQDPLKILPPGQNICADCERLIVGLFVRIKDKNLHVECFKCATCGTSLKNVGYYNISNKLYCDVHAKLVARQNPPAPNLEPLTIPPGVKPPASVIGSVLSSSGANLSSPSVTGPGSPLPGTLGPLPFHGGSASSIQAPKISAPVAAPASTFLPAAPYNPAPAAAPYNPAPAAAPYNPAPAVAPYNPAPAAASVSRPLSDSTEGGLHYQSYSSVVESSYATASQNVSSESTVFQSYDSSQQNFESSMVQTSFEGSLEQSQNIGHKKMSLCSQEIGTMHMDAKDMVKRLSEILDEQDRCPSPTPIDEAVRRVSQPSDSQVSREEELQRLEQEQQWRNYQVNTKESVNKQVYERETGLAFLRSHSTPVAELENLYEQQQQEIENQKQIIQKLGMKKRMSVDETEIKVIEGQIIESQNQIIQRQEKQKEIERKKQVRFQEEDEVRRGSQQLQSSDIQTFKEERKQDVAKGQGSQFTEEKSSTVAESRLGERTFTASTDQQMLLSIDAHRDRARTPVAELEAFDRHEGMSRKTETIYHTYEHLIQAEEESLEKELVETKPVRPLTPARGISPFPGSISGAEKSLWIKNMQGIKTEFEISSPKKPEPKVFKLPDLRNLGAAKPYTPPSSVGLPPSTVAPLSTIPAVQPSVVEKTPIIQSKEPINALPTQISQDSPQVDQWQAQKRSEKMQVEQVKEQRKQVHEELALNERFRKKQERLGVEQKVERSKTPVAELEEDERHGRITERTRVVSDSYDQVIETTERPRSRIGQPTPEKQSITEAEKSLFFQNINGINYEFENITELTASKHLSEDKKSTFIKEVENRTKSPITVGVNEFNRPIGTQWTPKVDPFQSPFVQALTTMPDPIKRMLPSQENRLIRPSEITPSTKSIPGKPTPSPMIAALTIAPDRPYSPLPTLPVQPVSLTQSADPSILAPIENLEPLNVEPLRDVDDNMPKYDGSRRRSSGFPGVNVQRTPYQMLRGSQIQTAFETEMKAQQTAVSQFTSQSIEESSSISSLIQQRDVIDPSFGLVPSSPQIAYAPPPPAEKRAELIASQAKFGAAVDVQLEKPKAEGKAIVKPITMVQALTIAPDRSYSPFGEVRKPQATLVQGGAAVALTKSVENARKIAESQVSRAVEIKPIYQVKDVQLNKNIISGNVSGISSQEKLSSSEAGVIKGIGVTGTYQKQEESSSSELQLKTSKGLTSFPANDQNLPKSVELVKGFPPITDQLKGEFTQAKQSEKSSKSSFQSEQVEEKGDSVKTTKRTVTEVSESSHKEFTQVRVIGNVDPVSGLRRTGGEPMSKASASYYQSSSSGLQKASSIPTYQSLITEKPVEPLQAFQAPVVEARDFQPRPRSVAGSKVGRPEQEKVPLAFRSRTPVPIPKVDFMEKSQPRPLEGFNRNLPTYNQDQVYRSASPRPIPVPKPQSAQYATIQHQPQSLKPAAPTVYRSTSPVPVPKMLKSNESYQQPMPNWRQQPSKNEKRVSWPPKEATIIEPFKAPTIIPATKPAINTLQQEQRVIRPVEEPRRRSVPIASTENVQNDVEQILPPGSVKAFIVQQEQQAIINKEEARRSSVVGTKGMLALQSDLGKNQSFESEMATKTNLTGKAHPGPKADPIVAPRPFGTPTPQRKIATPHFQPIKPVAITEGLSSQLTAPKLTFSTSQSNVGCIERKSSVTLASSAASAFAAVDAPAPVPITPIKPVPCKLTTSAFAPAPIPAPAPAPAPAPSSAPRQQEPDSRPDAGGAGGRGATFAGATAPRRGKGVLNPPSSSRIPLCAQCNGQIRGPFITALGKIWCPDHFICATPNCRRALADIGFVEEQGQLHCEFCFEKYIAPNCDKCNSKIKGDCLNAIGKHFHPECFTCAYCGKHFGNSAFFLEDGLPYCESDWNELFTTKCFACGFPIEAGDRWVEALNNNYHSQCFNCTVCKKNLEGQSFFAKGGRPFCKAHAR